ncbi:8639_t:CDS:2 [Cetraspora pellucida]|uniref:8639_t:CDS:1 n=1 Tax=Cetraspora pellucida TaxID=1433469 RepID=A0A9N8WG12_9GLOM|nr:8639_t:CDS:2 [Cetraspora pellucida]
MTTTAAKLQPFIDAGTHPESYYDKLLPPTSAQLRRWLLSTIRKETRLLAKIQNSLHHPLLDSFFMYSSALGSHTFFILFLPIFFWLGYGSVARRPLSPPIRRLSTGTHHLEYGFPSTHTTNAVSIALYLLTNIYDVESNNMLKFVGTICLIFYCLSVVAGRIYCDVLAGFILAILIWWIHWSWQIQIDAFILNESQNGAAVGMIIGSWNFSNAGFSNKGNVPCDFNSNGLAVTISRVIFGLPIIFTWRIIMKKILLVVLSPIYKAFDLIYQDISIKKKNIVPPIDMIIKLIVYTGIGWLVVDVIPALFEVFGIGMCVR